MFEAFGPCRFGGWAQGHEIYRDPWGLGFEYRYQPGEPMGKHIKSPVIQCMATEEGQVANVYETIYYNLTGDAQDGLPAPLLSFVPGVQAGLLKILLPGGGEIRTATSSSASKDGKRETFVCFRRPFDETHLYSTRELRTMYRTVTRNLKKRKKVDGTWYIETTTMYQPAGNAESTSIAELTYNEANLLKEGRKKRGRWRLMYDHRWGEVKDLTNEDLLRAAITEAYGDALAWMDLDGLVDEFYDSRNEVADSRRYFLNARTSASDAWVKEHEWAACKRPGSKSLQPGDFIALGFDGSVRGDASALCAVRITDMQVQLLNCWTAPDDPPEGWTMDGTAIDAAVAEAFRTYEVAAFYCDPAHMQSWTDHWTAEYGERLQVSATAAKPLEWWTHRERAASAALERFLEAVQDQLVGYVPWEDRDPDSHEGQMIATLTAHVLAARRAPVRGGMLIRKDTPKSKNKIDSAMAAMLALEAASDCVAKGVKPLVPERRYIPKRIR